MRGDIFFLFYFLFFDCKCLEIGKCCGILNYGFGKASVARCTESRGGETAVRHAKSACEARCIAIPPQRYSSDIKNSAIIMTVNDWLDMALQGGCSTEVNCREKC